MGFWDILLTVAAGAAIGAVVGVTVAYTVDYFITKQKLEEETAKKYKNAIYLKVKEVARTQGKVNVGIFDVNSNEIGQDSYASSRGLSRDIKVGQIIYV